MPTLKIMSIKQNDLQTLSGKHVILIPIRSFSDSKSRLSNVLDSASRTAFMLECATRVIAAAGTVPIAIVTSDPEVREFAAGKEIPVIQDSGKGLNAAVQHAFDLLRPAGVLHVTVAHADLPLAKDLTTLIKDGAFTIVPDRKCDGTNVISLPTKDYFQFSYGPMSFGRHLAEATRIKLDITIDDNPELSMDIDTPADYEELTAGGAFGILDSDTSSEQNHSR